MTVTLADAVAVLARTPAVLHAWLDGLPDAWLDTDEGPETFSPREVVGHLLQGERTDWIPRMERVMREDPGPFVPFDRFAHRTLIAQHAMSDLLAMFARERQANLERLRALAPDEAALARRGVHPDFGPVTGAQLLATWTAHDLGHIAQIARVMAKRYREAVGPWRAYLPVMDRGPSPGS